MDHVHSHLHIGKLRYMIRLKTIRSGRFPAVVSRTSNEMDIDAIHKALANPLRREILEWLKEPEQHFPEQELPHLHGVCAGQIDGRCGMSQSTVSAHLSVLQKAGLVTTKRVGQWVFFKRDEAVIQAFRDSMGNL
ncbi:ArsR family transcriptional regulator [Caballeronia peredens]|nr:ArsR family transcriptional regulator [Caballeronia peredens]